MFTQEQLLGKAALAAAKSDFQVLKVLIEKILSDDMGCTEAWEIYAKAHGCGRPLLAWQAKLMPYGDSLILVALRGMAALRGLRLGFFLWALGRVPHSSSVRLVLGEWALKRQAYSLTLWAWEGIALKRPKKKLLARIYSGLKLYAKAGALAQAVLKEEPYCTEMIDLLQASQFYQSMRT